MIRAKTVLVSPAIVGAVPNARYKEIRGGEMSLAKRKVGETVTISGVSVNDGSRNFLESLGFTTGEEVKVVSKLGGDVIVGIRGGRIALGRTTADRITVV
ncbi:MAG: ferrous iron transport protein A [Oscillospiraceae bacterium]|jgi:ferrous iron transport protein A|nr:ferrous iron transport protein A [Oscillospiraceae bacterium]